MGISLLADQHFAGHEQYSVLARVVALFDADIGQELVHRAASSRFFGRFERVFQRLLLSCKSGAQRRQIFTLSCQKHLLA
jgi:hypothetical protein